MSQMPSKPDPPQAAPTPSPRRASFWVIVLAVLTAVMLAGGVVVLTLGAFAWVIFLGLGIFLFAALHYLVWGWWLSGAIHREVAREDAERAAESE
ncbi:MAG: hypothetical protein WD030_02040 [Pirellulales bacterium]